MKKKNRPSKPPTMRLELAEKPDPLAWSKLIAFLDKHLSK